jgi:hypothetical protein
MVTELMLQAPKQVYRFLLALGTMAMSTPRGSQSITFSVSGRVSRARSLISGTQVQCRVGAMIVLDLPRRFSGTSYFYHGFNPLISIEA